MKQVPWNKIILEEFISLALLTKEEEMIMRTRAAGWTISKQAETFGMSESTVNRYIKQLKEKYNEAAVGTDNQLGMAELERTTQYAKWEENTKKYNLKFV